MPEQTAIDLQRIGKVTQQTSRGRSSLKHPHRCRSRNENLPERPGHEERSPTCIALPCLEAAAAKLPWPFQKKSRGGRWELSQQFLGWLFHVSREQVKTLRDCDPR